MIQEILYLDLTFIITSGGRNLDQLGKVLGIADSSIDI